MSISLLYLRCFELIISVLHFWLRKNNENNQTLFWREPATCLVSKKNIKYKVKYLVVYLYMLFLFFLSYRTSKPIKQAAYTFLSRTLCSFYSVFVFNSVQFHTWGETNQSTPRRSKYPSWYIYNTKTFQCFH